MNYTSLKIALLWIIITVSFSLHGSYHLSGLFYGIDIKSPEANGTVPFIAHLIHVLFEIGSLILAILCLYTQAKGFRKIVFGWSIFLTLVNLLHLIETAVHEISDLSQMALLSFVFVTGILIMLTSRNWIKEA